MQQHERALRRPHPMRDHWKAGYYDTVRTLRHPEVLERPKNSDGIAIFDFAERGSARGQIGAVLLAGQFEYADPEG